MSPSLEPPYGARDGGGMAARIAAIPEQIEEALERRAREPWRVPVASPALLAVGAMGGSAISADLTAGLYADRLPRPLLAVRDYRWPACVTREGLALLSSYSGNTEEVLALYREAGEKQIPRLALATGGALAAACARDAVPLVTLAPGSPPRAALYSSWVSLTLLVHALGWADDPVPRWCEAARHLRARNDLFGTGVPEGANPAKQLARALSGRPVFLYAAAERLGPVVTRMRNQLNENAKLLAHSAVVPELNHNEIVGWERQGKPFAHSAVVLVRDAEDSPPVARRLTLTGEYAARQGAAVHEVTSSGDGRMTRLASLTQFGDYLSLYLALLNGVDPTPIASIDEFKRRLSEAGEKRG